MNKIKNKKTKKVSIHKKVAIVYSAISLFIVGGFLLHTSSHPTMFDKYTFRYFISLFCLTTFLFLFFLISIKYKLKLTKKIVIVASLLLVLLFLSSEIYLRFKYKNYESNSYRSTIDNFDPFLQAKLAKNDNLEINSLGFRGEEIAILKPENTFRIVVLGGSTVLNREVEFEKNAARLLEKKLRLKYPLLRIEVINAGKDGYTTEHSIIQYLFKINDLKPDLVIIWHGINDMWASCTVPGFTNGSYKSDYTHLLGPTARMAMNYFRPQPLIQIKFVSLDILLRFLKDNFYSDVTIFINSYIKNNNAKKYLERKNTVYSTYFPSVDAYERNLTYLVKLIESNKQKLIIANQANMYKLNPSLDELKAIMFPQLVCQKENKYYDLPSLKYGIDSFNKITKKVAEKNHALFIDLDKSIPKNLNYFFDAVHYKPEGNKVIADHLYNAILDSNLIKN